MKKVKEIVLSALEKYWAGLKTKVVLKSNIVNNLTSTSTDAPLSASQGKVLKEDIDSLNEKLGTKQDASTAITTSNISNQSVNHAATAGSANAVAWGNVSGKPSTYPPSTHTHDDRYYTESEINNLLGNKARILRTAWGKTLTIPNAPHGIVISGTSVYSIWVAGASGNSGLNKVLLNGADELNFSVNAANGTVTATTKNNSDNGIVYIGS